MKATISICKFIAVLSMLLLFPVIGIAQELKVVSITPMQNNMAVSELPRDLNNNPCVPFSIVLKNPSVSFEGNVIGEPKFIEDQYLVYLTSPSKFISIKYPGLSPMMVRFSDYGISSLDSGNLYIVSIDEPTGNLSKDMNKELEDNVSDEAESLYQEGGKLLGANDYIHAYDYFLKAYNLGHSKAAYQLGFIYSDPFHPMRKLGKKKLGGYEIPELPVKRDMTKAFQYYLESAEKGYVTAQYSVGECYEKGEGVKKNKDEAQNWYQKAAEQGHLQAQDKLGGNIKHNKIRSVTASYGSSQNEFIVSKMVVNDKDLSARIYGRKNDTGDDCALIKVHLPFGGVTYTGDVIGEPIFKTNEYWVYVSPGTTELEIDYPEYIPTKVKFKDFGIKDLTGRTTYDLTLSFPIDLITDDSELTADDFYNIGWGYLERRDNQYIRWMSKAADLGHLKAMYYIGACYINGNGVSKDKEKGLSLLEGSAKKGLVESSEFLGLYYNTIDKDKKKSKMWYEKAEQQRAANSGNN